MFVEPPKDYWFVMGEYLPPPFGIIQLAAFLEQQDSSLELEVIDSQAEGLDWKKLETRLDALQPDIVAPSTVSTCNAYKVIRTLEIAKKTNPNTTTLVGGQHFSVTAQESLQTYPEIDFIIRGEGERTLAELVQTIKTNSSVSKVAGISYRKDDKIHHTPPRPLIENLDDLPFPGYHFVRDHMKKYHFRLMAGSDTPYALIEASRGCLYQCAFCSQWEYWGGKHRSKSPQRIADEMEYCYREFGSRFLWLTDDNFGLGPKTNQLCDSIIKKGIAENIIWFMQARSDDIVRHQSLLPKLRQSGLMWILVGLENPDPQILKTLNKNLDPSLAKEAMDLLKRNDILAQATLIIGERNDSLESIDTLRQWVNHLDPDVAIYMILTPYPGTALHAVAKKNSWIEDTNWAHYDMLHAIMPTQHLNRQQLQKELFKCYRSFYGSMKRRILGVFSSNIIKRRAYRYMMRQGVLKALRELF
ncbi:MAG: B12-binding domain-containing radical SAM protein [Candidatus Ranarchaeia archaeon]